MTAFQWLCQNRFLQRHRTLAAAQVLALSLIAVCLSSSSSVHGQNPTDSSPAVPSHVPLLDNDAAWSNLPDCEDAGVPLPTWARALAESLPHTTAAVLELDGIYRGSRALDPKLRAKIRWTAASANRCRYGMAYAVADLQAAGANEQEIAALQNTRTDLPAGERAVLDFARQMTVAAHEVTDADVEALRVEFGEAQLVAMVLQVAYANFMDRLVLSLGVSVEDGGPLPPRVFRFPAFATLDDIPKASRPDLLENTHDTESPRPSLKMQELFGRDWSSLRFDQLKTMLHQQQNRKARVSVPEWESVQSRLPAGMYPKDREMKIRWSLVVLGYQPELGSAWLRCLRVFGREAEFDRVLAESMFWVVTRSLQCFY